VREMAQSIATLAMHRELLWTLALREVQIRYRQAVLGAAWAVLQPVVLMAAFTLFFGWFLRVPSDDAPYPIFAYGGLLPWLFFAASLSAGTPSLTNNAALVGKVAFPREILPLAAMVAAAVDFAVAAAAFAVLLAIYGVNPTIQLLYVPVLLLIQVIFTAGIVLFLAALNVAYRDVRHVLPLLLQLWMFATPVIYPLSVIPERLRVWFLLNPMVGLVDNFRRVVVRGVPPEFLSLGLAALVSLPLLFGGYWYFKRAEGEFADII
jgi:lipopolysaccharide transport system permease protein